jgi:diaminopimelate epimerase
MSAVFHKATGSGNDFVMFDGRTTSDADWPAERIVRICDRRDGIGGDGLVIVTPLGDNAVRMTFFNADGSRAAMCGNAALCTTRFAAAMEMADPAGMTLVTDAGSFGARCVGSEGGALAELHLPDAPVPVPASVELGEGEQSISLGTVGVPHLVTVVDEVAAVDVAERGRIQRFHPGCGAGGANANFVSRISPSSGTGGAADPAAPTWALRTYERGVEGETLACGTGRTRPTPAPLPLGQWSGAHGQCADQRRSGPRYLALWRGSAGGTWGVVGVAAPVMTELPEG